MTINLNNLPSSLTGGSAAALAPGLEDAEDLSYRSGGVVYQDPKSGIDIGYGFQINSANLPYILAGMGVTTSTLSSVLYTNLVNDILADVSDGLSGLQAKLDALIEPITGVGFILTKVQAASVLTQILTTITMPALNSLLNANGLSNIAKSTNTYE